MPSGSPFTPRVSPKSEIEGRTSGRRDRGTPKRRRSDGSHRRARMSKSRVRLAFVASVACTAPPVRRQRSQESTVPKASAPRRARPRTPPTFRRIHSSLVAEK